MAPQCSVAMVAAFATAACDTVSSELGKACGGSTRLVTTLARVRPGTPGGVSGAGTLGGLAAAALLALAACGLDLVRGFDIPIVVAAAVAGALCESCLRATLLRDRSLGSLANLINTTIGALLAFGMHTLLDAR
jgi:uncharacterized protein (TIGR00297 family)